MIKNKSKHQNMRETTDFTTHQHPNKRNYSKENRGIHTAQHRNYSNQYIPLTHHFGDQVLSVKKRQLSNSKNNRKQVPKPLQIENTYKTASEVKDKRPNSSKNFIGCKLKKKIMKYLLFLSLVNYSLRVNYQRNQIRRYKIYVGKGNNSKLIKTLFANRFWWEFTQQISEAHLVWTQKSKKKVFKIIDQFAYEEDKNEIFAIDNPRRKIKSKRKDIKKYFCQQLQSILCEKDRQLLRSQCKRQCFDQDLKVFLKRCKQQKRKSIRVTHNHIQNHRLLTNKKNLFLNLKQFCDEQKENIFNYVPLTFHIRQGSQTEYQNLFLFEQSQMKKDRDKLLWIVKPGENSNRGCGIQICKRSDQVKKHIQRQKLKHPQRTFIVQKYISPYLFHRRKFDIRCFVLVTSTPLISAYFYPKGYIRTSSFQFSLKNCSNKYIHLTNDAIQKKANQYSKYENGNKVTFQAFQKYLQMFEPNKTINFFTDILPVMRGLVLLSIKSAKNFNNSSKQHTFQILGYDFMIDEDLQPWLIQINTNPCLETGCEILNQIIPSMVENAVKIAIDPIFKPPKIDEWPFSQLLACSEKLLETNNFQLIYSQLHEVE